MSPSEKVNALIPEPCIEDCYQGLASGLLQLEQSKRDVEPAKHCTALHDQFSPAH